MAEQEKEKGKEPPKDGEAGAEKEASAGGNKKKKIIIIAAAGVLLLAAIGGGLAFFLLSGKKPDHPPTDGSTQAEHVDPELKDGDGHGKKEGKDGKEEHAGKGGEKGKEKTGEAKPVTDKVEVDFGATYVFKTFHLNLGNPLENHYIRLEISAEYKGGDTQRSEIERRLPQLRDAIVSVTSQKSREFLLGPDGKDQLRREILIRVNRYMTRPLDNVFITDILIE